VLLVLREHELAVAQHVELAAASLVRARVDAVLLQLGDETRRPLVVAASGRAVKDVDAHETSLVEHGDDFSGQAESNST
jgi:hypothetical protein